MCAAALSPPGRPVPSGGLSGGVSEVVSADMAMAMAGGATEGLSSGASGGMSADMPMSADMSMSGGAAEAMKSSQLRPSRGHSSLLLSIRVSPCNLDPPVYKGGQGLLCEGQFIHHR